MVKATTPLSETYAIVNVTLVDGEAQRPIVTNSPAAYKATWTKAKIEKDGFHGVINTVIDGVSFKGSFMLYKNQ
jgi:hypothetical protein